jgi:hypothetical protein
LYSRHLGSQRSLVRPKRRTGHLQTITSFNGRTPVRF